MPSVICTLFEGNYHKGVAGLVNSLYYFDFRGDVFIGYRGALPQWADAAENNPSLNWPNAKILKAADGLNLHFLPVDTHFHFTTYKPYFMLQLLEGVAKDADGVMYFDPDIIVKCKWDFYEKWITFGVGIIHEIINNDMPPNHPVRLMWKDRIEQSGKEVTRLLHSYINAGFCGVSRSHIEFIKTWCYMIDFAIEHFEFDPATFLLDDPSSIFRGDQDALNMAAMCSQSPVSEMGPQAMGFIHGGYTMSHAVGSPKPWNKRFIFSALKGYPPGTADKDFWLHAKSPIKIYSDQQVRLKRLSISAAAFMSRFYKRN